MNRLLSVTITGLAGRDDILELTFERGVNVLWGMNGSGKTTLLRILHSALTGDATQILRMDFESAEVVASTNGGIVTRTITASSMAQLEELRSLSINSRLARGDRDYAQLSLYREAELINWASSTGDTRPIAHRYLPISRISDAFRGERPSSAVREILDESEFDRLFAQQIQRIWEQHQLNAERRVRLTQQSAITEILRTVLDPKADVPTMPEGFSSEDAEKLLMTFFAGQAGFRRTLRQLEVASQFQSSELFQRVVATVYNIQRQLEEAQQPEKRFIESVDLLIGPTKRLDTSENRRLQVSKTVSKAKTMIPLEALSSGEKQILRILLETLVAEDSLVIVDEPELSLHVDWQSKLLSAMQFVNPKAQIVVASHAPDIVGDPAARKVSEV